MNWLEMKDGINATRGNIGKVVNECVKASA